METRYQQGFNLLELMAAITILGILLGLGVPAFTDTIRNNRVVADTNKLVVTLSAARSEAVRRGVPVAVCASTNAASCAGATTSNWATGWIMFTDDATGAAGVVDGGDEILQKFGAAGSGVTLTTANLGIVRFLSTGLPPSAAVETTFTVKHTVCHGVNKRTVRISATGRLNTTKGACP